MRNLVLIGMPGSGKSTLGREVARWLGWTLVDTDALVAAQAGRSVEEIFARDGEAAFRRIERRVVRKAAADRRVVIATGGGVAADAANMAALRRRGLIVSLGAPPEVLLGRLGRNGGGRPLLAQDPEGRLAALAAERAPRYADAEVILDATRPPEELAARVLSTLTGEAEAVTVALEGRSYEVLIGAGILDLAGWEIRRRLPSARQVLLLTHPRLRRTFGARVERVLQAAGLSVYAVTVPEGERSKSLRRAAAVFDAMLAAGVERAAVVVGLGGGVVGDLAGFVAGTYMRGVPLVHLPTTLLAQVDSAIGGKAAVNHPRAKNAIGVIWQPALVMSDLETLRRAPLPLIRAGLAEAVKHGMVADGNYLAFLEAHLEALLAGDPQALAACVRGSAAIKAAVVAGDEREEGRRRILNYGHTVGHALEIAASGRLSHGECVAVGMAVEAWIAHRTGLAAAEVIERQEALLRRIGLPTALPAWSPEPEVLIETMRLDKKTREGEARFTLVQAPGDAVIERRVDPGVLREALAACRASS